MVRGVINTLEGVSARRDQLRDGFEIRRAAPEQRIPCFTSLDTARVVADCLGSRWQRRTRSEPCPKYWSFDPGEISIDRCCIADGKPCWPESRADNRQSATCEGSDAGSAAR